ncbi:MAG: glycosyltransferase family 4 protein [Vibrio sp.]|uniref:glycosyltransferase family 4 protein n=1 Tax=Vibrio sp. TaxID=678 RepID=UPI003A83944F
MDKQPTTKHIAFLINDITQLGGTERMCVLICNELSRLGYKITIISQTEANKEPFFLLDRQVTTERLFEKEPSLTNKLALPVVIGKKVKSICADLYISCDTQMCLFSSIPLLGKKHIGWEHFNSQIVTTFGSRWFGRRLASLLCDKIIVLTESDKKHWVDKLNTNHAKLAVIPNPLPVPRAKQIDNSNRQNIVLAMGRMTEQKGFDLLIQAWSHIPEINRKNWILRIVGPNGSAKPALEMMITKHHLEHCVQLIAESKQVEQEYQQAAIYVLSSRYEGFGLTLIEAMGQGLPVIAYDCPMGPAEIIANDYGRLVKSGDIQGLAESIEEFIADSQLRQKYSDLAYQRSAIYSPDIIIRQWVSIIQQP